MGIFSVFTRESGVDYLKFKENVPKLGLRC